MVKLSRQLAAAVLLAGSVAASSAAPADAGPGAGTATEPGAAPAAEAPADPDIAYAARVLRDVNAYRQERGLPALLASTELTALAAAHSRDMAARRRLSHDGFPRRFEQTVGELCVENVAQGFKDPDQVLAGWQRVPTHHRNLLEKRVRHAGVAASGRYVTYFACDTAR